MLRHQWIAGGFIFAVLFVSAAWAASPTSGGSQNRPGAASTGAPAATTPVPQRLREGEVVQLTGKIELSGDQATLQSTAGHPPLRLLENLALERIARVLGESRDERLWTVSGVVTEYRGVNYILITRAVQSAQKP